MTLTTPPTVPYFILALRQKIWTLLHTYLVNKISNPEFLKYQDYKPKDDVKEAASLSLFLIIVYIDIIHKVMHNVYTYVTFYNGKPFHIIIHT